MITGSVEPNDDECDWPSDEEKEDEQLSVKNPAVNTLRNRDLLYERFEDNDQNFLKKFFYQQTSLRNSKERVRTVSMVVLSLDIEIIIAYRYNFDLIHYMFCKMGPISRNL